MFQDRIHELTLLFTVLFLGFFKNDGSFKLNLGILAYVAHSSEGFRRAHNKWNSIQ
jgi:hypothetical protein